MTADVALRTDQLPVERQSGAESALAALIRRRLSESRPPPSKVEPVLFVFNSLIAQPHLNRSRRRAQKRYVREEIQFSSPKSIEERLYDRLQAFKILTAQVSMHLDSDWRTSLFNQLDFLLNAKKWREEVSLPSIESYETFLKFLIFIRPYKRPSFGVDSMAHLVATWSDGDAHLFVNFQGGDSIRWAASQIVDERREAVAGQSSVTRLLPYLSAFRPERWFPQNG